MSRCQGGERLPKHFGADDSICPCSAKPFTQANTPVHFPMEEVEFATTFHLKHHYLSDMSWNESVMPGTSFSSAMIFIRHPLISSSASSTPMLSADLEGSIRNGLRRATESRSTVRRHSRCLWQIAVEVRDRHVFHRRSQGD